MEKYNTPIKYGIYGAALSFVVLVILLISSNSPWSSASWMGCWIPGMTAYYVLKLNSTENERPLSYGEALRLSMFVVSLQALFYNVLAILFMSIFDTGALDLYRAEMMQNAEQLKALMGEQMFEEVVNELQRINYFTLAFWDFVYKLIGGFILSLIFAGIFKKNKPIFEN